jgi:CubicO group peptidase (beta-lactamase class C family)
MYSRPTFHDAPAPPRRVPCTRGARSWTRGLLVPVWIILGVLVSSVAPSRSVAGPRAPIGTPNFAAIDQYVRTEMAAVNIPGLALGIVHGDQIVHLKGFGVADPSGRAVTPQTPFNIASMAKAMTALAIMQLVESGTVDLAAPVQRYLPWFQVADSAASARITVQHLLNHTSGLPEAVGNDYPERTDARPVALETRVRALRSARLNRPVGTTREYCNANYDVLGLIVQLVSGLPYERYIQQHIFEPLAMHRSFPSRVEAAGSAPAIGYRQWFGLPVPFAEVVPRPHLPSGRQFSTAEDLAHLLIAYLNGGRYGATHILSADGIQAIRQIGMGGDDANFKARALIADDEPWGIVILMNTQAVGLNGPRQEHIKDGVYRLLGGQQPMVSTPHFWPLVGVMGLTVMVSALLAVGIVRSTMRLRRRTYLLDRPRGWRQIGWDVGLPLGAVGLWVLFLGEVVRVAGSRSSRPLRFLLEYVPDVAWLIIVSAGLALGWGVLRTSLAFQGGRWRAGPARADSAVSRIQPVQSALPEHERQRRHRAG